MSNLITPRFQLVELQIPATQIQAGQITFAQVPQLQSFYDTNYLVYALAIDIYSSDTLTNSPFNSNLPVATANDLKNATLTLVRIGDEAHKEVPLAQFSRFTSPGSATPHTYEPFLLPDEWQIDWTKSYVHLIQAPVSTPPFSYLFGVHYSYYPTPQNLTAGMQIQPWMITGPRMRR